MPLFRRKVSAPTTSDLDDHAVLLHFKLSDEDYGSMEEREAVFSLQAALEEALVTAGVGELDGNEFGGGEAVLYMYGPDKDRLWAVVEPVVRRSFIRPTIALLRAGGPGVEAEQVPL